MNGEGNLNKEAHREAVTTVPTPKDDASALAKAMELSAYLFYQEFCMRQHLFAMSDLYDLYMFKHKR